MNPATSKEASIEGVRPVFSGTADCKVINDSPLPYPLAGSGYTASVSSGYSFRVFSFQAHSAQWRPF